MASVGDDVVDDDTASDDDDDASDVLMAAAVDGARRSVPNALPDTGKSSSFKDDDDALSDDVA
jgi:hypothetical protein